MVEKIFNLESQSLGNVICYLSPLLFPVMLCMSFPLHEFFIFFRHQRFQDFPSGKFPSQDFFLEIVNPPPVIPNGLPLIIMAEFARWREEVNPVAIGQDEPTLPARWSRKVLFFAI